MTASDTAREPTELEVLLPWYAAGTLRRRDRQRVEEALRNDADLARQVDLVREEFSETIHFNETLGAPPPRVLDRLMASIDAETDAARKRVPGAIAGWLTGYFANLSPRTMAMAASFAVLALALQGFMLVDIFTKPQSEISGYGLSAEHHGTFATVRFVRQANAGEITNFLQDYQATLVDGPTPAGVYKVRLGMTSLAKEELARIVQRMRRERIVETADADE
jgi:hypothetical protein